MINVWNENVSLPSDGAKLLGSEEGCVSASSSSWITSWCSFNLKWCFCHQGNDFMSVRKVNLSSSSHSKSFCDSPNFLFSMSKIHHTGTLFFSFFATQMQHCMVWKRKMVLDMVQMVTVSVLFTIKPSVSLLSLKSSCASTDSHVSCKLVSTLSTNNTSFTKHCVEAMSWWLLAISVTLTAEFGLILFLHYLWKELLRYFHLFFT